MIPQADPEKIKEWDQILSDRGLGMDRGLGGRTKDGRRKLVYGHEYFDTDSVNINSEDDYSEESEP